jgi:hypothetical protein
MIPSGVGSLTIPANSSNTGDFYKIHACGTIDTDGNKDYNIEVKLGGVSIATAASINTDMNGFYFSVDVSITFRSIGAAATVLGCGKAEGVKGSNLNAKTIDGSGVVDTTASNAFTMEFTWAEAGASRTVTIGTFQITYYRGNFDP